MDKDDALFTIWIGVNDIGGGYALSDWSTPVRTIVSRYFEQVPKLYNLGARCFILLSVPTAQKTPRFLATSAASQTQVANTVATYISLLTSGLKTFMTNNNGAFAQVFNTLTAFETVIENSTAYGAPDATCTSSNGASCIWWDSYHPGLKIHKLLAQDFKFAAQT